MQKFVFPMKQSVVIRAPRLWVNRVARPGVRSVLNVCRFRVAVPGRGMGFLERTSVLLGAKRLADGLNTSGCFLLVDRITET